MKTSLDGVLLKIGRAKEHRESLKAYIAETFAVESNCPRLGTKFEEDTGDHVIFVEYVPDLDEFLARCSLIVGDTVHNLHSALDRLAYQLALMHTGGIVANPIRVQFPIADAAETFASDKRKRLREIAPNHVAIIERFQGYHTVNLSGTFDRHFHPLSLLRDLASIDKHRLPIDLFSPSTYRGHPFNLLRLQAERSWQSGNYRGGGFRISRLVLGAELMRTKAPPGTTQASMEMAGKITPQVTLSEYGEAIPIIDEITAFVAVIIRQFEPFF